MQDKNPTIPYPAVFALTNEDAYFIIDLPGSVILRVRSFEEHATVFEIVESTVPQSFPVEDIETEVTYDNGNLILIGPNETRIVGERCSI